MSRSVPILIKYWNCGNIKIKKYNTNAGRIDRSSFWGVLMNIEWKGPSI